jgi:putative ABC transport system ATP-binding protein
MTSVEALETLGAPPKAAATPRTLVEAVDIVREYHMGDMVVRALAGVSTTIGDGEYLAVMGPSGSGKSTFMNLVGALDRPTSGALKISGRDIGSMSADELAEFRNRTIGFVFQQFNLLARTSAVENVELPLLYAGVRPQERRVRAMECLKMVGLGDRADHHPSQLSGGQQQRVAIARALANRPKMILADEPTGALDSKTTEEILGLFEELNKQGITMILVTHDRDVGARARRRLQFRDGQIERDER